MTVSLQLLVLRSHRPDQARAFYQSLGIDFTQEQHGAGPIHFAGQVGELVLEIYPLVDEASSVDRTTRLGFVVSDLGRVIDQLRATGAPIVRPPQRTAVGDRAVVCDPDGRNVELYGPPSTD